MLGAKNMEVNFAGQYTKQDFLQAQRIHYMPSPVVRVLCITAIVAVVAIYIAQFFLRQPGRLIDELGILLPAFIIIYVLAMPFLLPFSTTSQILKDPDFQAPISGTVDENGVKLVAKRSTSEMKWELYIRAIQKEYFVMLYQPNKWYNLFPRRFFHTNSDWEEFLNLVKTNIQSVK
jgi:hypothetical protein